MRWMLTTAAALLLAGPLAGQETEAGPAPATPEWTSVPPLLDSRLRADFAAVEDSGPATVEMKSRLSAVQWMMVGAGVGCVAGTFALSAGHENERQRPALRMQGCILGASVGGPLLFAYGLLTGAR